MRHRRFLAAFLVLTALALWAPHPTHAVAPCSFTNAGLTNGNSFTAGQYVGVVANASCPAAAGTAIAFVLSGAASQVHVVSLSGTSQTFAGTQFVFSTSGFAPGAYAVSVAANGTADSQGPLVFWVH